MSAEPRPVRSRRTVLRAGALTGLGLAGATQLAAPGRAAAAPARGRGFLVGRGLADATGEVAEVGMMGYGRFDQQAAGLHTRLRARAFVVADEESGRRVLLIVADSPMIFSSVHQAVLRRLADAYGDLYTEQNVLITATHTHAGPGGYSHHLLYNTTTFGFHRKTFEAVADGLFEAAQRAHDDLAPSELVLSHGTLTGASVNRSRTAFDRNPKADRDHFPDAVDTHTTLLRVERDGRTVGAVNWFPVHSTSMSGDNRLVSADNKGYAAYHWEREVHDVDYLADGSPAFVSAFAQTNSGDMSPNLDLQPPTTPEDFAHTRANGLRQYEAAAAQVRQSGTRLSGPVDSRLVYVDLSDVTVEPEFTGDGRTHRTSKPCIGASMAAGSMEDGPAFPGFEEGENPFWDAISDSLVYTVSPELKQAQAPKDVFVPIGEINRVYPWVQERVPVMLVRIGALHLIGVPGEVTVCAGLRLRRTVAGIVGADLDDVLVAGYANAYFHYLTTPEEYDTQQYEGGSTLFGRWQLPALQQTAAALATSLRDGTRLPLGPKPPDLSDEQLSLQPGVVLDAPPLLRKFGDVLVPPRETYRAGERAEAVFAGAHPGNDLHRGDTYLEIQRRDDGGTWRTVADDGDWPTRFHWARDGIAASKVTITWDIPQGTAPGSYRIVYHGDAKSLFGAITPITGTSPAFMVR
ncbi:MULTISPECIES: neutral/alkaline ceramidase [unclassified Streptomyces]|uniref:neutral/alkaline ceramidase n=1 Tax=unclassified Streptomyces TaxID=2593676 RepID=UPI000F6C28DA|nr:MULTISPECIES: neutral/alkaline ceramidase [unclassified Streptomyces]AZM59373.1 alkaline ceramidase [Streptomyces sp. WAC 01438]RSM94122.1 alkaline ceramidase [Streptomyces sp. WAC 01420]